MTLTLLSLSIFLGFVVLTMAKFGVKDCWSAYAKDWKALTPNIVNLNVWSLVMVLIAVLLIPPLLSASEGSVWQFTGFLCPACLIFVGLTPSDGNRSKLAKTIHAVCAPLSALWAILYILLNATFLWWLIPAYCAIASVATLFYGKWSWNLWFEYAAFAMIYTGLIVLYLK